MTAPVLSIVIVTFNSRVDVERCLRSLIEQPPRVPHEIVVVDNASGDGTPGLVREWWPGVRVIDAGANLGFSRANNIGIRSTTGEFVLLLNPDAYVPPDAVDTLLAKLRERPDAGVIGPRIVDPSGRAELSFGRMISPFAELYQKVLVTGSDRGHAVVQALVERMTRRPQAPDWVSGACLLARRADLEAVGLLDERFFMYTEDVDLCAMIRARGRIVLFTPDVEVVHSRGRSVASAPRATEAAYRRSQLAFYAKHHPRWLPWLRAYLKIRGRLADKESASRAP